MSVGDVMRYVPGIGVHQGENNRDQVIIRGNSSSADFFVDGVRDDVQYYRDLYNVDRVEALKGPNAMIFGRGGGGGVVNRVFKEALFMPHYEVNVQGGEYGNKRLTADLDQPVNDKVALRVNGMIEHSDSFRNGVDLESIRRHADGHLRGQRSDEGRRLLRISERRSCGRSRHPVVSGPARRCGPLDVLRQPGGQRRPRPRQRRLGHRRASSYEPHVPQSHDGGQLRSRISELRAGCGDAESAAGGVDGVQQRHRQDERVQPDRRDVHRVHRLAPAHAARRR